MKNKKRKLLGFLGIVSLMSICVGAVARAAMVSRFLIHSPTKIYNANDNLLVRENESLEMQGIKFGLHTPEEIAAWDPDSIEPPLEPRASTTGNFIVNSDHSLTLSGYSLLPGGAILNGPGDIIVFPVSGNDGWYHILGYNTKSASVAWDYGNFYRIGDIKIKGNRLFALVQTSNDYNNNYVSLYSINPQDGSYISSSTLTNVTKALPQNYIIGCDDWMDYVQRFGGMVNQFGSGIDCNNTSYVSNTLGAYDSFSRSYQNYVDIYDDRRKWIGNNFRLVLARNTRIGVNSWDDYKAKFPGLLDSSGRAIDYESNSYISNNEGGFRGYGRSYINYGNYYNNNGYLSYDQYGLVISDNTNEVIMYPKGYMKNTARFWPTMKFQYNSNGGFTNCYWMPRSDSWNGDGRIIAAQYFVKNNKEIFVDWLADSGNYIWPRGYWNSKKFSNFEWNTGAMINGYSFDASTSYDYNLKYVNDIVYSTYYDSWRDKGAYFLPGYYPYILQTYTDESDHTIYNTHKIDFDSSDIDMFCTNVCGQYGYGLISYGQFYGSSTWLGGKIIRVNLDTFSGGSYSKISWSSNNDLVSIYDGGSISTSKWSTLGASSNGTIAQIQGNKIWLIDPTKNSGSGGWAYDTTWATSNHIYDLAGVSNLYAGDYRTDEKLKQKVGESFVKTNYLKELNQNSSVTYVNFDNSENLAYYGQVKCNLSITNGYYGGNYINFTLGGQFTVTGFKQWYTRLSSSSPSVDSTLASRAAASVTDTEMLNYVRTNYRSLIVDFPVSLTTNDITIKQVKDDNEKGTKEFYITLSRAVLSDHNLSTGPIDFKIKFYGFVPVKETRFIPSTNQVFTLDSLSNGSGYKTKTLNEVSDNDLLTLAQANISRFYANLPDGFTSSNVKLEIVSRDAKNGQVIVKPKITKYRKYDNSIGTDPNQSPTGQIIFSGFKPQLPTSYSSSQAIDMKVAPWNGTYLDNYYAFQFNENVNLVRTYLILKGFNLLENAPSESLWNGEIEMLSPELTKFNALDGTGTAYWKNKTGFDSKGNYTDRNLDIGSRQISFKNLKTVDATSATENDTPTINKKELLPSTLTPEQMKDLVKVNTTKLLTWGTDQKFYTSLGTIEDIQNSIKYRLVDASDNDVTIASDNEYFNALDTTNSFRKFITPKQDLYTILGNPNWATYTLKANDDYLGTATIHVSIPNSILSDGQIGTYETDINITGLKALNTEIKGGNLNINRIAEVVSSNDIINAIIDNKLVINTKDVVLTNSDLQIVKRDNNNITGIVTCDVMILGNNSWINGVKETDHIFRDIQFTGFTPVEATKFNDNPDVNGSATFGTVYADDDVTTDQILNYVYSTNQSAFVTGLAFDTNITNVKIIDRVDDITTGTIKFKVELDRYIDEATGHLVTDKLKTSNEFTLSGFKNDNLDTEVVGGNLNIHKVPSKVTETEFKEALVKSSLITAPAKNQTIGIEDITLTPFKCNDVKGTITTTVTIIHSKAWTNGKVVTTKEFANLVFTDFDKVPGTEFVSNADITDEATFGNMVANDQFTDAELIDYILRDNAAQFIINPSENTTSANIKIIGRKNYTTDGYITFKIELYKFMDPVSGELKDDGIAKMTSHLFTLKGFYHHDMTTDLQNATLAGTKVPSATSNEELARLLIESGAVTGIALGKTLEVSNIKFSGRDDNDVTGTITVNVSIEGGVAWENGVIIEKKDFYNIKLSGFSTVPATEYVTTLSVDGSAKYNKIVANNKVDDTSLIDFILQDNAKNFINGLVPGTTSANISLFDRSENTQDGTISFRIRLNKFMDGSNGHLVDGTGTKDSDLFTITGFYHDKLTTEVLPGALDVAKLPNDVTDNDIASAILSKGLYDGIVLGETLLVGDIAVEITDRNNITGTIIANVTINNSKAWTDGNIDETKTFNDLNIHWIQ